MKHNPFITEILRGEWLIHEPEVYYELAENFRKTGVFNFKNNPEDIDLSAFSILDDFGTAMRVDEKMTVPRNSIAQISLRGEIAAYSDWCIQGADQIVENLFKAQENSNVDATVFRIDTPGGSVKAGDNFSEFGRYKKKPVVGLVKDALSLGYLAAIECCDYIMMDGDFSSRVGSIGVVATLRDNTKMLEEAGIKVHEIYPPESNHKNKDIQEAKKGEYSGIIKNSLSPLAKGFQNRAIELRTNLIQEEGVLNGAVYFAKDAVRLGLADGIGDIRKAIEKARELALKASVENSLR
jgi:protease-4